MKRINLSSIILGLKRLAQIAYQLMQEEPTIEINGSKMTFMKNATLHLSTRYLIAEYSKGWLGSAPLIIEVPEEELLKLAEELRNTPCQFNVREYEEHV